MEVIRVKMKYRQEIEKMMSEDYGAFCKALFSIESGIDDETALENLYVDFMDNDEIQLINSEIFKQQA